jgi:2,3-bisphosphoglycerate-dependent phosphoglycerate mutase
LGIEEALNIFNLPVTFSSALNERDYGEYTGKNKAEVERLIGADAFKQLRRGWDYPVPGGETLKMVYERIVPYYIETIVPKVLSGENVLIVSHGNTIRSLMKYIEGLPDEEMQNLEMLFGNFLIYEINKKGLMTKKEMRESPQPLKS